MSDEESHAVPDDHIVLIGRVAETWAQFEFHVDQAIWSLVNAEQQLLACITSQFLSMHPRMRAYIAICSIHGLSKQTITKLNKFSGRISGLADKRNRAVHDPRYRRNSDGKICRLEITARPTVQFDFLPEDKEDLKTTIRQITKAVHEFIGLHVEVIDEIQAIPPEDRPQVLQIIPDVWTPQSPTN